MLVFSQHRSCCLVGIGDLLIKHPLAITYLLRHMFGTKRIRQLETRQKCARLVALAAIATERKIKEDNKIETSVSDEDILCQVSFILLNLNMRNT